MTNQMSKSSAKMTELLRRAPMLPLVVLDDPNDAVPLAEALLSAGLPVIEVALRTPAALRAIEAIARDIPEATIGAGTVTSRAALRAAASAGASFVVSPGATSELLAAGLGSSTPLLPGVATPSDVIRALEFGYGTLKFFPAAAAGGTAMLKALHGPFPDVSFCPTGGINAANASDYLALPNVVTVGGSWVAPDNLVKQRAWAEVRSLAADAVAKLAA